MDIKTCQVKKPVQLSLFESVELRAEHLMAINSPRRVVYNLWLIREPGGYIVRKESGAAGKKMIDRVWRFEGVDSAEFF